MARYDRKDRTGCSRRALFPDSSGAEDPSFSGSEFLYEVRIPSGKKGRRELPLEFGTAFHPPAAELRR